MGLARISLSIIRIFVSLGGMGMEMGARGMFLHPGLRDFPSMLQIRSKNSHNQRKLCTA